MIRRETVKCDRRVHLLPAMEAFYDSSIFFKENIPSK
jgi:hypothetical protein